MRTILILTALVGLGLAAGAAQAAGRGPDGVSVPAADHAGPAVKPVAAEVKGGKGKGKG